MSFAAAPGATRLESDPAGALPLRKARGFNQIHIAVITTLAHSTRHGSKLFIALNQIIETPMRL